MTAVVTTAIRMAAMALAAIAVGLGVVSLGSMVVMAIGAAVGVLVGEGLARLRQPAALIALALLGLGGAVLVVAFGVTSSRGVAETIGPGTALWISALVRHGLLALIVTSTLRLLARRVEGLVGLELLAVAAAWATAFATHRHGVIDRPLWLSDWATEHGHAPAGVLLAIGAAASLVLGGLLLAQSGARRRMGAFAMLPVAAVLALVLFEVGGTPKPPDTSDLGLTGNAEGSAHEAPPGDRGENTGKLPDKGRPDSGDKGDGKSDGKSEGKGRDGKTSADEKKDGKGGDDKKGDDKKGEGKDEKKGDGKSGDDEKGDDKKGEGKDEKKGDGKDDEKGDDAKTPKPKPKPDRQQDVDDPSSEGEGSAPMAVVLLGDDYDPPGGGFYFRQGAWSHFNGSRLVDAIDTAVDRDIVRRFPAAVVEVPETPPAEQHTLVHTKVVLVAEHAAPFGLQHAVKLEPQPNPNPARFVRAYAVESMAPTYDLKGLLGKRTGRADWPEPVKNEYLRGPTDPRYAELARKLVADLPEAAKNDPFAQALAVKVWMDKELIYSSAERHAGADDPTGEFLFGNRTGYCVHFAHAAVYLWRSLGIPARVGNGYHVPVDNRRGSTIVITSGDAHAWPELYLDGIGWVILDIAAARNLDQGKPPPDDELAEQLAEQARKEPDPKAESHPEERAKGPRFGTQLLLRALWLLVVAAVGLYAVKIWRALCWRMYGPRRLPVLAFRAALDRMAEVGAVRAVGETREAFARRVANVVPALAQLTALNVAARLAPGRDPKQSPEFSRRVWEQALTTLQRERAAAFPLWRRVIGALNPTSFVSVR